MDETTEYVYSISKEILLLLQVIDFVTYVSLSYLSKTDEHLKKTARERRGGEETVLDLVGASIIAKFVASALTYPHEVLRSRMQDSIGNRHLRLFQLIRNIIKKEGILSLWSGIQINCIRIVPATICTFLSYEYLSRYMEGKL